MKEKAKRILTMLVAVSMVLSLWPTALPVAKAADKKLQTGTPSNEMIFETVTGTQSGDRVGYFAVRYLDTSNIQRVQYIFPQTDLAASYKAAAEYGGTAQSVETALKEKYSLTRRTTKDSYDNAVALQPYHRDMFLFTPDYEMKKITGVEIFGNYEANITDTLKNSWDCQGLRIYSVSRINGLERYGKYSMQYFIDFTGELKAELEKKSTVTFAWND